MKKNLRDVTLVFLVKRDEGGVCKEVCLAMKKRGFGVNKWNGIGGKVDSIDSSIKEGAIREVNEEIGVNIKDTKKVGELKFYFSNNPSWNQLVHVFIVDKWEGEPKESEEMNPKWFSIESIPYDSMWADDRYWLPKVLDGKYIRGSFTFGSNDVIEDMALGEVYKI